MSNSIKIDPLGFREYDARWLYPKNISLEGIKSVGKGFGTQITNKIKNPRVTVGHDYRSYSEEIKKSFIEGLIATGCIVLQLFSFKTSSTSNNPVDFTSTINFEFL